MNRRNFIKALTLVPVVIAAGKIKFEQYVGNKPGAIDYKQYFYGGNAGGGKTWHMHEAQKRFFETPLNVKIKLYRSI